MMYPDLYYKVSDFKIKEKHGGHLGFWNHNSDLNCPGNLVKEIFPKFATHLSELNTNPVNYL